MPSPPVKRAQAPITWMVVDGNHGDRVDALGKDGVVVLEIAGQMVVAAGRRERAGHAEQHDALARENLACRHVLGAIRRHCLERGVRQFVSDCYGHATPPFDGPFGRVIDLPPRRTFVQH